MTTETAVFSDSGGEGEAPAAQTGAGTSRTGAGRCQKNREPSRRKVRKTRAGGKLKKKKGRRFARAARSGRLYDMMTMDFGPAGRAIQKARRRLKMTQEELGESINLDSNSISRLERGCNTPSLPTLIDICNALGVGAGEILAGYVHRDSPRQWTDLAKKMYALDAEKQSKLEEIMNFLIGII